MRSETRSDSRLFRELLRSLLKEGISVSFRAEGNSMYPAIADGDQLLIDPAGIAPNCGDVVISDGPDGLLVHRVIHSGDNLRTRGDCCFEDDGHLHQFVGAASIFDGQNALAVSRQKFSSVVRRWIARWRGHF